MVKKIPPFAKLFVLMMFLLGFFLRAQETLSRNFLFLMDSGRDMMDVKRIVFDHKLTLIGPYTSLGGVFQGPLYYYLLSIPTAIFRGDPWGNILLMLILSLSVLAVVFYFMNKYFGLVPAIITFVLFVFSPEAVAAATFFWNPHPMWLILTLYIFILYGALQKNKWMELALWPLIALSFHFEIAFGVFLSIATFLYFLIFNRNFFKSRNFWIGFLLSGVLFLPQIIFDLRHNFLMTRSVIDIFSGHSRGLTAYSEKAGFVSQLMPHYGTLKNNLLSSFPIDAPFQFLPPLVLLITFAAFVYSIFKKAFSKSEKLFLKITGSVTLIIIFLSLIYPFPLRSWFLTGFQSFYLVLAGLILSKLYKFKIGKGVLILVLGIFLIYSGWRLNTLYFDPPNDGGLSKIKGKTAAIDYIYRDAKDKKFGVLVFTPGVYTYPYDYLIWWYGRQKYGYQPYSEKRGIVYLLMEPDPEKPWSYKGWLETVVKTGRVLSTKTLPSGIIIQKRDFN